MTETCPNCGFKAEENEFKVVIRPAKIQVFGMEVGVADIGYGCPRCGKEFGFDIVEDGIVG